MSIALALTVPLEATPVTDTSSPFFSLSHLPPVNFVDLSATTVVPLTVKRISGQCPEMFRAVPLIVDDVGGGGVGGGGGTGVGVGVGDGVGTGVGTGVGLGTGLGTGEGTGIGPACCVTVNDCPPMSA